MKRVIAIADRAALVSLKLLVALNLLFFLSFIVVLLLASRAHAEAPNCAGTDLLTALEKSDPATFQKVEAEAAAVP
ncbi:polysaccharide biosynthesis protein GumN, partial [Mesorhizobium sp. M1C.F.Ca.ET.204.01.1.1]